MRRGGLVVVALIVACGETPTGSTITGHAVFAGVQDHSGIRVTLSDGGLETETDAYGYFAIASVRRGSYLVTASHDGTRERRVTQAIEHDGTAASSVHLVLSPVGRVVGNVVDADGRAIVGASIARLGLDEGAVTVEGGIFVIDPATAGSVALLGNAANFDPTSVQANLPVGGTVEVRIVLERSGERDPYAGNNAPVIAGIVAEAAAMDFFPRPIPAVGTAGGRVRRSARYVLTADVTDPEGDPVTIFWSADRGTLESTTGPTVVWVAGRGASTITASAFDNLGATATARTVLTAGGDNIRGAGHHGRTIYYSERRGDSYDLYTYNLGSEVETLRVGTALEQHATQVVGDWLVHADSEFVFVGPLVYRIGAQNLVDNRSRSFGQAFDHDSYFIIQLDLYTPLSGPFVPYYAVDASIAPSGYGFFDLETGQTVPVLGGVEPAGRRALAYDGNRFAWVTADGRVWTNNGGPGGELMTVELGTTAIVDVQIDGDNIFVLPESGAALEWYDLAANVHRPALGVSVTSFAAHGGRVAYVEQGPTVAEVILHDLVSGAARVVTGEPHYARRIWALDDSYVIWGDQGTEGQAFMELNTELLWVDQI